MTIVIGSVPYLNEKPLTRWFEHTPEGRASGIEVVYEVPSTLAAMLARGEIAAGLMSSFEYFRACGYQIVPGVSIAAQDEILSVRAFSRLPWRQVQSVALDTSSLTSNALLKILLAEVYNAHPAYLHHKPDLDSMLEAADAALLIGDAGMLADDAGLFPLDLGAAWRRLTGHPFVYACWIARPESISAELIDILQGARDWGVTQIDEIATEQAELLQCPRPLCHRFLTEIMDYNLGQEELAGLEEFGRRAFHHQLLPDIRPLDIAIRRGKRVQTAE
ncbi:MAG: menaquinone biosynthetic enzyme MqnA/MqnD family protein [Capsulimonadaceae bacterium]